MVRVISERVVSKVSGIISQYGHKIRFSDVDEALRCMVQIRRPNQYDQARTLASMLNLEVYPIVRAMATIRAGIIVDIANYMRILNDMKQSRLDLSNQVITWMITESAPSGLEFCKEYQPHSNSLSSEERHLLRVISCCSQTNNIQSLFIRSLAYELGLSSHEALINNLVGLALIHKDQSGCICISPTLKWGIQSVCDDFSITRYRDIVRKVENNIRLCALQRSATDIRSASDCTVYYHYHPASQPVHHTYGTPQTTFIGSPISSEEEEEE